MDPLQRQSQRRWFAMVALIVSGEMIFSLPFHLPRYFRPSMLETFNLSNANLGDVFAVYGVTAMVAYFPGGILADRIAPRKLMAASLLATAAGGLYLMTVPGHFGLAVLYGYWGVTTIFLFWAAMIRATRRWGGLGAQGRAFGLLEGGRGLAAAGFASAAVFCFAQLLPGDSSAIDVQSRTQAMQGVIAFYSAVTVLAAILIWLLLGDGSNDDRATPATGRPSPLAGVRAILRQPLVWMQAAIVICAYCGYKGLDNYALYAHEVLGMDELASASITAKAAYIRPLSALGAGLIADRFSPGRCIMVLFGVLCVVYGMQAWLDAGPSVLAILYANIFLSFVAVFALRAVYFAVMEEIAVPAQLTGTAVGLISVLGYTPDIFFAPIAGRILDASPGIEGHQHYFLFLTGIAIAGLVTSAKLGRVAAKQRAETNRRKP